MFVLSILSGRGSLGVDSDFFWHSLGGGAILAAAFALARLLLDYGFRGGERRGDQEDRRRGFQRDAEARLERVLQDRLADADRRFERCDAELQAERVRSARLEHDLSLIQQAYELLKVQYLALRESSDDVQRLPR
jgi:chromosome segregation ATPase